MVQNLKFLKIISVTIMLVFVVSCGSSQKRASLHHKKIHSSGKSFTTVASWYGKQFQGRKTASGERFNMYKMTAAHKTLPFGTKLLVENLNTKNKAVVIVNDRGPFIKGRGLDLSYVAAKKLGFLMAGSTHVKATLIEE